MSWDESWATAASLEENMGQDFNIQQPPQIVAQVGGVRYGSGRERHLG